MNEVATQTQSRDERFIKALEKLERDENRSALAALRRGLGKMPGTAMETHPYVVPFTQGLKYTSEENAYYIIATLFGLYPCQRWGKDDNKAKNNLGASLALLKDPNKEKGDSLEKRFVALLNTHMDDLPHHLRQAISLLKSKEMPVNWLLLLEDIKGWNHAKRKVQRKWANSFWGNTREEESSNNSQANQKTENKPV